MAWAVRCAKGSLTPWVAISFCTASSDVAFQKKFKKAWLRRWRRNKPTPLVTIRAQDTRDMITRMTNRP